LKKKILILGLLMSLLIPMPVWAQSEPSYPAPLLQVKENVFSSGVYAMDLGYGYLQAISLDFHYQIKILIENHKVVFLSCLFFEGVNSTFSFIYSRGAVIKDTLNPQQGVILLDRLLHFWPEGFPEKPETDSLGAFAVFLAEYLKL
jgi:hypothetical protein